MLKYATTSTIISIAASLFILNGCPYSEQHFNSITTKNKKKLASLFERDSFREAANLYHQENLTNQKQLEILWNLPWKEIADIYHLQLVGSVVLVRANGLFAFHPVYNGVILPLNKNGENAWCDRTDIQTTVITFSKEVSNDE